MTEQERLRYRLGCTGETETVDCLAIALACYFENHCERPEDDPDHEDHEGWGQWVIEQTNAMLDRIVNELQRAGSSPALGSEKDGTSENKLG